MDKKFIGIDLGTENIGFAVTDGDYRIMKVYDKPAVGVRVYGGELLKAKTAEERRLFRTARRRLRRRKYRIALLQEIFAEAMSKVDVNFYAKLNENDRCLDDKRIKSKFALFNDSDYNDRDYYRQYPTIYHLRKDIMDNGTDDIRKLYLAVHHIIKYRGHFINADAMSADGLASSTDLIIQLNSCLEERNDLCADVDDVNVIAPLIDVTLPENNNIERKLNEIYLDSKSKYDVRINDCCNLLSATSKAQKLLVNAIFGRTVNVTTMFGKGAYESGMKAFKLGSGYDEAEPELMSTLESNDYQIIALLKQLHDNRVLMELLRGSDSLSSAMIDKYQKHHDDLCELKQLLREYSTVEQYKDVFDVPRKNKNNKFMDYYVNYTSYIGGGRPSGKEKIANGRLGETATQEEFGKYIKEKLKRIKADGATETINRITADVDAGTYMPRIVSKNNSIIPYQLNLKDLNKILDKVAGSDNFAWLNHISDGITAREKIIKLLTFRVPYYVGVIKDNIAYNAESNDKNSARKETTWAVRKGDGKGAITPWNFEQKINLEASNAAFIDRMSGFCTYLKEHKALPMKSIAYSKFIALSELNKLKINDVPIDHDTKTYIWNTIYLSGNGIPTSAKIANKLKANGYPNPKLSGFDEKLRGDMSSYHTLKNIIGDKVNDMPDVAERIIKLATIHNESSMMKNSLENEFAGVLSDVEINKLKGLRYNGWGRFSRELLEGVNGGIILVDKSDGERKCIINIMQDTTMEINEIIHSARFNFAEELREYNKRNDIIMDDKVTYEVVDEMYCSPSVKRSVWQTFRLIKELVKDTGGRPDKIFIETTREIKDNKKGKTSSRKEQLQEIYKKAIGIKNDIYLDDIHELNNKLAGINNKLLDNDRIFLYFMQLGRCAYSNEPINVNDDFSNLSIYDIDHIIPQSKKKDNSIDNTVLVKHAINKEKGNKYPVEEKWQKKAASLWKYLHKAKLMSDEKYSRLTRTTELTQMELAQFINRQLVETAQMALLVRDLLDRWLNSGVEKTEIVLNKGANISDFRRKFNITKSREVNNYHHAIDAYINIVVGNVLNEKYNHQPQNTNDDNTANFMKAFDKDVYSYRNGCNVWSTDSTIQCVRDEISLAQVAVSKKVIVVKGKLYKQNVFKSNKNNKDILDKTNDSAKKSNGTDEEVEDTTRMYTMRESKIGKNGQELNPQSNPEKYGYRQTSSTAYYVVVDSVIKGKVCRSIEGISIYQNAKIESGIMTLEQALLNNGLVEPKLAVIAGMNKPIIKSGALVLYNGAYLRLSGMTGNRVCFHNANELHVDDETNNYIKEISIVTDKINKAIANNKASINKASQEGDDSSAMADETESVKKEESAKIKLEAERETQFILLEEDKKRRKSQENQKSIITMLTKEGNERIYDFFVTKINKKPYASIPGYASFIKLLNNSKNSFMDMTECKQAYVLLKLITAFQCNAVKVDGSDLNYNGEDGTKISGSEIMCSIYINKVINQPMTIIHQNISGLRERRMQLWHSGQ